MRSSAMPNLFSREPVDVTNQMIQRRERGIEPCVMIENCPRAIDVKWRAKFVGYARKIDIFTVEAPAAIMKKMHRRM